MINIRVCGEALEVPEGTTYEQIAKRYQAQYDSMIGLCKVNGRVRELFKQIKKDCTIEFVTLQEDIGHKAYVRSAIMLLLKAIFDLYGKELAGNSRVEYAIGHGYYIAIPAKQTAGTEELAAGLKLHMEHLRERCIPFIKQIYPMEEAMDIFRQMGMRDKETLFRFRRSSAVNIYECDGYYDYFYGHMLPHTGYIKWFDVIPYDEGVMLLLPTKEAPEAIPDFMDRRLLFETLRASDSWGSSIGIETVGDLNEQICSDALNELILVQEAEQERRIGEIAREIVNRGNVKFVMIAGPSSSGKTSFSHRLSIQLRTLGKIPHPIALDDYFVDREKTPRDENGDYNFECLEAIDLKAFNEDMVRLLKGERIELPSFNFKTGKREYTGHFKQLGPEDILVIEGIHGLNPRTAYALPEESKFKIYISALTSINIDAHNRIPTTDGRLLRRMVRDARTRAVDARRTIQMWPSVRRGEELYIFPFQEEADAMFNSALVYELAVLKPYAEALLFQISKDAPEYYEANRLLKFLDYFLTVSRESIPNHSICREFVGGSCFRV